MNLTEIAKLQELEHEAFIDLMYCENNYGMRDESTEYSRTRWGVYYDLLDRFKIEPIPITQQEVSGENDNKTSN